MLTFQEYKKNCSKFCTVEKAKKMYAMYIKDEEEIMGQSLTLGDMLKCKQALTAANTQNIQFVSYPTPCCDNIPVCIQEQEGTTTPMNTNDERNYLNRRLDDTIRLHDRDLYKQFHIGENTMPKTYKDMIDWVKNGKFEIDAKSAKNIDACIEEAGVYYGSFLDGIIWTGCGFKVDRESYDAGHKVMRKALQEAKDIVNTSDAAAGLKALQTFEAWTYEVPKAKKH